MPIKIKNKGLLRYLEKEIFIDGIHGKVSKDDNNRVFIVSESNEIIYPQKDDRVVIQGRIYDYDE
jgi:hypothetical protein